MLPSYSIAIRTLGTAGEKFIRELDSIARQTIKPEKVVIYIAEGYKHPEYSIGIEQYVEVKKGMVAQRVLEYSEINSEYILMLDDDIELAPNGVELLLNTIVENNYDCIAADIYKSHNMSVTKKIYNIIVNLTLPHYSNKWAFKFLNNGSNTYNNNPQKKFYQSQSAAGGCSLWKKNSFLEMNYKDELWLESLGFSYGEDLVIFNKLHKNGKKLGVLYNTGTLHLDGRSSRASYQSNINKFYIRSLASFIIWYRLCYNLKTSSILKKKYVFINYIFKIIWQIPIYLVASIKFRNIKVFTYFIKGICDGIKYIKSDEYKRIPNYILN